MAVLRYQSGPKKKVSFIVSKKFSKLAVERNLWKRRGRAIFQKLSPKLKPGFYVFFLKPEIKNLKFKDFENYLFNLIKKNKLIYE